MRTPHIHVHIEELVLHGFPASLGDAIQTELTRLVAERGAENMTATVTDAVTNAVSNPLSPPRGERAGVRGPSR